MGIGLFGTPLTGGVGIFPLFSPALTILDIDVLRMKVPELSLATTS
jgi:hypothetical protein